MTRTHPPVLRLLTSADTRTPPLSADPRTARATCDVCGAHAAVVTCGASVTGACSVCGSGQLTLLDERLPPPRRWAR